MKKTTVQTLSAKRLLSPQEFAQRLSVSRWTVYAMLRDGRIQSVKIGRLVRIPESEVERLIEAAQRQQQEVENG
jgi:excisionase family DNA binding protein